MTELNVVQLNEVASGTLASALQQIEDGLLTDEDFLGELYGKLVTAHTLGWDVKAMAEEATLAGGRLIEAIEAVSAEAEE